MFGKWPWSSNMKIAVKKLADDVFAGPQISPADIPDLVQQGFRSIICNRPDHEEAGQPEFADIARAARAAGLEVCYVPIDLATFDDSDEEAFVDALKKLPHPVLAYCLSGARSTMLWSLVCEMA